MLLTEQAAKEKWCPFARVGKDGSGNRYSFDTDLAAGSAFARCIASDCMAWRWGNEAQGVPAYEAKPVAGAPGHFDNAPMGYCGLAGRAE
ncbi:MAG: hypothetical protein ACR2RE_06560 [Geminicoccaceae bacterium]